MAHLLRLGLIGAGIQASKTPAMHMAEAHAQGFDIDYRLIDLNHEAGGAAALPALLARAEAEGYRGLNITHPCKQSVIAHLDALSPDAEAIGAVNTVLFDEGRRIGHNTDWIGFAESFKAALGHAPRQTALQIGAGGAGAAVAHACLQLGFGRLLLQDADPARTRALAQRVNRHAGRDFVEAVAAPAEAMQRADGVINCTPMGMASHEGLPLEPDLLTPRHWVAEIVYFPLETALLRAARTRGCAVMAGGGMAVGQAVAAFAIFTGKAASPQRMQAHFEAMINR